MTGITLTLFLSLNGSLTRWQETGILNREMKPYLALLADDHCKQVQVFSYDHSDRSLLKKLQQSDQCYNGVKVVTPRFSVRNRFCPHIWALIGPILHHGSIRNTQILKTNQVSGSWAAVLARLLTGRPLVFRMGYLLSRRFALNGQRVKCAFAQAAEALGFRFANRIIFTAQHIGEHLDTKGWSNKSVHIPSYVDLTKCAPLGTYDFAKPFVTICRLTRQKNLKNLIRACGMLNRKLVIYGTGPQRAELEDLAKELEANVIFGGLIDHDNVAGKLQEHSVFILPSYHEGLPKSLMEAMACGLVCAASNIPGVTDLIEDRKSGYLINGHQRTSIATVLLQILQDRDGSIGQAAHQKIALRYGLTVYVEREAELYAELV